MGFMKKAPDHHFEVVDSLNSVDILFSSHDKDDAVEFARTASAKNKRKYYVRKETFDDHKSEFVSQIVWRTPPEIKEPVKKEDPNAKQWVRRLGGDKTRL